VTGSAVHRSAVPPRVDSATSTVMARSSVPSEVEIKLLIPTVQVLHAIGRLKAIGAHPLRARRAQMLHSVYLDTPDLALARRGVALRLRRDGSSWEVTAKWSGTERRALHERPELNLPLARKPILPFRLPPGPLRCHLAALVRDRPLKPLVITDTRRRRLDVMPANARDGEPVAELALDTVQPCGPRGEVAADPYCEIEIELRRGTRRTLSGLARRLQERFDLVPSPGSKFQRALSAVRGLEPPSPPSVEPVRLGDSSYEAVCKLAAAQLRRLLSNDPGCRLGRDPEAVHDMRVATRRLRAALHAFEAGVPGRLRSKIGRDLKWLGRALGRVRDLDVLLQNLDDCAATLPAARRRGIEPYRRHLQTQRAECHRQLLATLDSPRYFDLLTRVEDLATGTVRPPRSGEAQAPIALVGRRGIKRAFRRLLDRGSAVGREPAAADLHALRIRAKRLRYVLEFMRELTGGPGRRLVKRLVRLQDLLGTFNDAQVATGRLAAFRHSSPPLDAGAHRALEALDREQRRRAEKARSEFRAAWNRFSAPRIIAEGQSVLRRLKR
jgi:triphosphatase